MARSIRMGFGRGIVALEEEEQRIDEASGEATPAEDQVENNTDTLETELLDVQEGEAEHEEVAEAVDEGLDTVEALENLREAVSSAAKNGGLDQKGAQIARISLESLYGRVGLRVKAATPALEMFGGQSDRVRTTIALEADIKENLKKIWDYIVAAVKRSIEFVTNLFGKFFGGADFLVSRSEKLIEQADKVGAGSQKETEVKSKGLAARLHFDGKVAGDDTGAKRLAETYSKAFKSYPKLLEEVEKASDAAARGTEEAIKAANDGFSKMSLGLKKVGNPKAEGFDAAEGMNVERSDEMPGGQALVLIVPSDVKDAAKAGGGIQAYSAKAAAFEGEDVPLLDKDQVKAVAGIIGGLGKEIKEAKRVVDRMTQAKKKLITDVQKAAKVGDDEAERSAAKQTAAAFKAALQIVDRPFVSLNGYALKAGKAVLEHCEVSLRAYKEEKKEEPTGGEKK